MNNRIDERKKSNMEKEIEDEVKNRAMQEKKNPPRTEVKKNPSKMKWIIGWTKEKKSSMEKEKDNPEVKKRIWGEKKTPMKRSE